MKNTIKYTIIAIIIGIVLGRYTFNEYKETTISTMKNTDQYVYLMQYGVYKEEKNMKENTKKLKNYLYFLDNDGYHVLIGITKNKKNKQKIVESYEILTNIYMKKVKIDNEEFLELLNQYDSLIEQTNDKEIINNAQKQILSKYEELILNSE
ncbi:MAG: hypothetical protein IJ105_04580 [Bacilli bacterium]|nr:hypothetical protein [Bacilli bacterium]